MLKGKTINQRIITYAMKHVEPLGWAIISCIVLFFFSLILIWADFFYECALLSLAFLMLLGVILYAIYQLASRFRELIDALKSDILDVEWIYKYTLKFTTSNRGEFYLQYYYEREHESAHYIIWITSDKSVPVMAEPRVTLWSKPYKPIFGNWQHFPSPPYVPVTKANEIKTLKWIAMDWSGSEYRILARLSDEWLQSETDDLMKVVELLEKIYAGM